MKISHSVRVKSLIILVLAFSLSSCNQKLYQDSLKKNEALEAQVVRSNKEIKDLREQKLTDLK